jgi:hypothetical protein
MSVKSTLAGLSRFTGGSPILPPRSRKLSEDIDLEELANHESGDTVILEVVSVIVNKEAQH